MSHILDHHDDDGVPFTWPVPKAPDPYWDQVRDKAAQLGSDGCTMGAGMYLLACLEHDIHCRTGMTLDGQFILPSQAHKRFLAVMQAHSKLGWWSPVARYRYLLVKWFYRPPPPDIDPAIAEEQRD